MPNSFTYSEDFKRSYATATTLSGTVKVAGLGVKRELFVFKFNNFLEVLATGWSAEDGSFSFTFNGSKNDRFTIICIGKDDSENTTVFSGISGA